MRDNGWIRGVAAPPFGRVIGSTFIVLLGFGAAIPTLPVHLREQVGASTFVTGLLLGISSATALMGRLLGGRVADHKGRKPALILGAVFCAAAGLLYQPLFGLAGLTIARLLHGLGEGFFITASVAWGVDLAAPDRRAQALGFLATGVWGGVSVGPLIGAMLGSWSSVAVFVTLSALAVIPALAMMKEAAVHAHAKTGRLVPPAALLPGLVLGFANVAYAAMAGFLVLLMRERGRGGVGAFSAFAMCVLFSRLLLGSLPDRLGPRKTLFIGFVFLAAGLSVIAVSANPLVAMAAAAVVGLGYSFPWPSLAIVVLGRCLPSERAAALGTLTSFYDIFVALGSLAAGAIASRFGLTSVFWMAVCSVGCSAALAWITRVGAEAAEEEVREVAA